MDYVKRVLDQDLDVREKAFGAIQIIGPKGSGKTRTAKERCKTIIPFQDENRRKILLNIADINPNSLLQGEKPILFDEWQDAPKIWGAVRMACDDEDCFGAYYLTGSSAKRVQTAHSGTARISTVTMYPMSLYESGDSNGKISLTSLFAQPSMNIDGIQSNLDIDGLIYAACRGGWPRTLSIQDKEAKLLIARDYFRQICQEDISRIDGKRRNPEWAETILKSYARNVGTLARKSVLLQDVTATAGLSESTFDDYVERLKELFVLHDVESWCPQIRSEKSLRAAKKRLFVDPSIAVAALHLSPSYFRMDYDLFGHIFENLVFRDLAVYSSALDGSLSHYHDAYNLETNAVLHLGDGRYALIEVKLGGKHIEDGVKNLLRVESLIKESNQKGDHLLIPLPTLKMVITGAEYAYRSPEGVLIVPIGCLKD